MAVAIVEMWLSYRGWNKSKCMDCLPRQKRWPLYFNLFMRGKCHPRQGQLKKWFSREEEIEIQWDRHNYLKQISKVLNLSVCLHIKWNGICSKTDSTFHDICMTSDAVCMINICQCATPRGHFPCVWHNVIFFCKVMNICKAITVTVSITIVINRHVASF